MTETKDGESPSPSAAGYETTASPEPSKPAGAAAEETAPPAAPSSPSGHDDPPTPTTTQSVASTGALVHEFIDRDISSSTATSPAAQVAAPPLPQQPPSSEQEEQYSPDVMSLHSMFPSLEPMIIQSVLESVGGDQDRATDVLLGMSDPEYVPQETQRPAEASQTDLDEQFARRLVMEEQQRQSDWENQLGYQPRRQNSSQWGGGGSGDRNSGGKDTVSDLSESFNKFAENSSVQLGKFAESSKKTLSSFMTKVKAKVQEFDSNRSNQGSAGSSQSQSWSSVGGGGTQTQAQQNPQYYSPPSGPPPPAGGEYNQMVGYDATSSSTTGVSPAPIPQTSPPRRIPVPSADISAGYSDTQPVSDESSGPPKPPSTSPGPPAGSIDRAKLGMLPKKPVSLSQTPQVPANRHDEDEDELDYVENPFEEGRH